jgi:Family of unknown function (DUF5681)
MFWRWRRLRQQTCAPIAMAENAGEKQRRRGSGRRFRPGESGNPKGKQKGCKHRVTLLAEQLMADDAESVVRAVISAAQSGDMAAAKLILDRVCPVRRSRPTPFSLPNDGSTPDILELLGSVVKAMANGTLTAEEGASIASVIEVRRKAIADMSSERGGAPPTGMVITIRGGLPDPPEFDDPAPTDANEATPASI